MTDALVAETHPAEYLIHKYWSRKPANVLRQLVERHTEPGDLVLDPFCGSGVACVEALRAGRHVVGIDVNPVAGLITRVSADPPEPDALRAAWERLAEGWAARCDEAFGSPAGPLAHCVHALRVPCAACGHEANGATLRKTGRRYACPACGARVRASLATADGSRVIAAWTRERELVDDPAALSGQSRAAETPAADEAQVAGFDRALVPNARILAHEGLRVSDLFTRRSFSLLGALAARIEEADEPEAVRRALWLLFTSAVASCSRLVPYRDNMRGGGPAWSVPGFWVAPVHLERNPRLHLEARASKLLRGLEALRARPSRATARILTGDAVRRLEGLAEQGVQADWAFIDPPYGDSVPYLEFSQLWNCWLRDAQADWSDEIVVSDRTAQPSGWDRYAARMDAALSRVAAVLKEGARITVSFNNLDLRAWRALLGSTQRAELGCVDVVYQVPAVVSAKAQLAPTGSYVGDVYATFVHEPGRRYEADWAPVRQRLEAMERLRGGAVGRVPQLRVAALTILERNLSASLLDRLDALCAGLPRRTPPLPEGCELHGRIAAAAREVPDAGSLGAAALCARVAERLPLWYALDRHDILRAARG